MVSCKKNDQSSIASRCVGIYNTTELCSSSASIDTIYNVGLLVSYLNDTSIKINNNLVNYGGYDSIDNIYYFYDNYMISPTFHHFSIDTTFHTVQYQTGPILSPGTICVYTGVRQ